MNDVPIFAVAARGVVTAEGHQFEGRILAGHAKLIGMTPGIDQPLGLFQIGAAPAPRACGGLDKRIQPNLLRREAAIVERVEFERCGDGADLALAVSVRATPR